MRTPVLSILSIVTVVALVVGAVAIYKAVRHAAANSCRVNGIGVTYTLEPDQATNATTIAAVGKRIGLPNHAVTIALAAALQESKLHNLAHGDRDSLGLFQQRPSQGWGTASEVQDPAYAATAFFTHLAKIDGWQTLPVTTAAQRVQRSSAPNAYAKWENEARALARATTGEVVAAFTCRATAPKASAIDPALQSTMNAELGPVDLAAVVLTARGWTVATWLVAHARRFGINTISFAGERWTTSSGTWTRHSPAVDRVQIERTPAA
ncbi:MAG: hypothetical protein QOH10_1529 [Actinomycetota bacterium]|nr:hypothetical protein [Actinomycetota bacterium]